MTLSCFFLYLFFFAFRFYFSLRSNIGLFLAVTDLEAFTLPPPPNHRPLKNVYASAIRLVSVGDSRSVPLKRDDDDETARTRRAHETVGLSRLRAHYALIARSAPRHGLDVLRYRFRVRISRWRGESNRPTATTTAATPNDVEREKKIIIVFVCDGLFAS